MVVTRNAWNIFYSTPGYASQSVPPDVSNRTSDTYYRWIQNIMLTFFLSQKASYLDIYHEKSPWPAWLRFPSHQCCENRWFSLSLWSKTATIGNMLCELATEAEICHVMTKKKSKGILYPRGSLSMTPPLLTLRAERPLAPGPAPRTRGSAVAWNRFHGNTARL